MTQMTTEAVAGNAIETGISGRMEPIAFERIPTSEAAGNGVGLGPIQAQFDEIMLRQVLDSLPFGVFVTDAGLRMLFSNKAGARLLKAGNGLRLCQGILKPAQASDEGRLNGLVRCCSQTAQREVVSEKRMGMPLLREHCRPLLLVVSPLQAHSAHFGGAAVLFVSDPEKETSACQRLLQTLFDLTDAESRLTLALLKGHGLAEAAEEVGMSLGTAHTHLRHIFSKTDTSRQAELVRLILSTPLLTEEKPADQPKLFSPAARVTKSTRKRVAG